MVRPSRETVMSDNENVMESAQRLARPALPRRFYKVAAAVPHEAGFAVALDGRLTRTPARKYLAVPQLALAEALAAEWDAQVEEIDPGRMPLTRLVNSAIDRVSPEMAAVREDVVSHAGSDLLLYRAEGPQSLVDTEESLWGPILAASEAALGTRFTLAEGIVHVEQDVATLAAVDRALASFDPLALAALHSMMTLTGSALIALAFARGEITAEEAWAAAHADEDWQAARWGRDEEAFAARERRWEDMQAAAAVLKATRNG
jgi:chaperone required for assembly of F1-ATPase